MTVQEALTVREGLYKLNNNAIFLPMVAWYEPAGVNLCNKYDDVSAWLRRVHVATEGGRCKFCGTSPSSEASFERPADL